MGEEKRELKEMEKKLEDFEKQKQNTQKIISDEIESAKNFAQNSLKQTIILEEEIS